MDLKRKRFKPTRKDRVVHRALLPEKIVFALREQFEIDLEFFFALHVMKILYAKSIEEQSTDSKTLTLCQSYIIRLLNGNRNRIKKVFAPLVEGGIINKVKGHDRLNHRCAEYILNKEFTHSPLMEVYYEIPLPSRKYIRKKISELNWIEHKTLEIQSKLSLCISRGEIEKVVNERYPIIKSDVESNTTTTKKGKIKYNTGKKQNEYKIKDFENRKEFVEIRTQLRLNAERTALERILHQQKSSYIPSRKLVNRRMYNILTNVPSNILKYVLLDGEHLIEIDLSNSQFVILSHLLLNTTFNNTINQYYDIGCWWIEYSSLTTPNSSPYLYSQTGPDLPDWLADPDLIEFVKACASGQLYETISKKVYGKDMTTPESRKRAKVLTFRLIFGNLVHSKDYKDGERFWKVFPTLNTVITNLKNQFATMYLLDDPILYKYGLDWNSLGYDKKVSHNKVGSNLLPILLQRTESVIFIDHILNILLENGFLVLTKHDSFLIKESDYKDVYPLIQEEFIKIFGEDDEGNPRFKLRVTKLSEEN